MHLFILLLNKGRKRFCTDRDLILDCGGKFFSEFEKEAHNFALLFYFVLELLVDIYYFEKLCSTVFFILVEIDVKFV